jgi:YVTN family beta-propeller protein
MYVIDRESRSVVVVGTRDSKVVHRWRDFADPRGLGIRSDGANLYVTSYGNDTLSIVDTASITVGAATATDQLKSRSAQANRKDVQVGRGPFGVAWSPASGEVFVANSIDNTCTVVNTGTASVRTTFATGETPQDVAATFNVPGIGYFAFITCLGGANEPDGSVSLYWNVPNGLQATLTGFKNPKGLIYDRNASVWVANSGGSTVSKLTLQIQGNTILPTITATANVGKNPSSVTLGPWPTYFNGAPLEIISADRGSSQLSFIDAQQPFFTPFALPIPGVQEVAAWFDQ